MPRALAILSFLTAPLLSDDEAARKTKTGTG